MRMRKQKSVRRDPPSHKRVREKERGKDLSNFDHDQTYKLEGLLLSNAKKAAM